MTLQLVANRDQAGSTRFSWSKNQMTRSFRISKLNQKPFVFALTAFIFYFPALYFPIMKIELYGLTNSTTVYSGAVTLFKSGNWFIAAVVFLASIVVPLFKILMLLFITTQKNLTEKFKIRSHQYLEIIGPWAMLDIFLVSILISIVKLGSWANIDIEIGSLFFLFVVIFSILATSTYKYKKTHISKILIEQD